MNASILVSLGEGVLGVLGLVIGNLLGRRSVRKQADAAIMRARAEAKKATTSDWAAFNSALLARLESVESRVTASEARADAAVDRAERADALLLVAVRYLRQIGAWVRATFNVDMPPPPTELGPFL